MYKEKKEETSVTALLQADLGLSAGITTAFQLLRNKHYLNSFRRIEVHFSFSLRNTLQRVTGKSCEARKVLQ